MLTRRRILRDSFAVALTAGCALDADRRASGIKRTYVLPAFARADALQEESARGFRSLLPDDAFVDEDPSLVILPAVRSLPTQYLRQLRKQVEEGAWVIWERAANFDDPTETEPRESLARFFAVSISDPIRQRSTYIRYRWPIDRIVRSFHDTVRLACLPDEVIAECEGQPVSMKRAIGKGGIVFLGTMLGPGIRAEEREAREIGRSILNTQRFA